MAISNKKVINELKKAIEDLSKAIESTFKNGNKETKKFERNIKDVQDDMDDLSDSIKNLGVERGLSPTHVRKFGEEVMKLQKEFKDLKKEAEKAIDKKDFDNISKASEELDKRIATLQERYKSLEASSSEAFFDMGTGIKEFGNIWGAMKKGPGALRDWSKNAQDYADKLKMWPKNIGKAGMAMRALGGSTVKLGSLLGGVGKLLGGWGAIILGAAKKIIDFQVAMDRFVKNANKAFATIRGPDIMTTEIKEQFKEFNDQIYNIADNIRVGLDASQIREFMNAVYQAGQNITQLNTGIRGYRDAIYIAAKASKTLSMELPQVGSIIGELMTNFRMDMGRIDDAFVQVAFDAKKSGLSTDRFWSAIQNASASLAFYGIYIEQASKMMAKFSETQVMGADQTGRVVEDITQSFKRMDKKQRMSFISLADQATKTGTVFRDAFSDLAKDLEKRKKGIADELAYLSERIQKGKKEGKLDIALTEQYEKLQNEQANISRQILEATKASKGDLTFMAAALPMLADQTPKLLNNLAQKYGGFEKLSGEGLMVMEKIFEKMGLNADLVMELRGIAIQQAELTRDQLGLTERGIEDPLSILNQIREGIKGDTNKVSEKFNALIGSIGGTASQQAKASEEMVSYLSNTLKWNKDTAQNLVDVALVDSDMANKLKEMMTQSGKMTDDQIKSYKKELSDLMDQNKVGDKLMANANKAQQAVQESMDKQAEETFKKIVNQTLSLEEMGKIAKEGANWELASLGLFTGISEGVHKIVKMMASKYGYDKEEAKDLVNELDAIRDNTRSGAWMLTQKRGIMGGKKGEFTQESIVQFLKYSAERITKLNETGEKQKTALDGLNEQIKAEKEDVEKTNAILAKTQELNDADGEKSEKLQEIANKLQKETNPKKRNKLMRAYSIELAEIKKKNDLAITKQKDMVEKLGRIDEKNKGMYKFLETMVKADPEAMKQLGIDLGEKLKDMSIEEVAKETGLSPEEIAKAVAGASESVSKDVMRKVRTFALKEGISLPVAKVQGIVEPMTIASAAMPLIAHRGETLMPAEGAGGRGPKAGAAGVGGMGGKNITINVNATEKDLAQRIANEIRSVMYREQLVGMG